jgi:Arc/MetJ-type ribon-helix-helix transcriptional regulator
MESMVKKRIAVTVSEDLLKWVDKKVKETTFANRSHAVERALTILKQSDSEKKTKKI